MKITRKDFLKKTFQGAAVISVPLVLSPIINGCSEDSTGPGNSNSLPSIQGSLSNGKVSITIDSSSPLSAVGSAAIVNYSSGSFLVNHPSADVYNALSSICTHQACVVSNYDPGSSQYVCPCHGSRYNFNGQVVQGPANASLRSLAAEISGDQLIVTL